ncbi:hypothetical protein N7456_004155 [Penicillium angulare]|uniref:Uncharacterized protein n=1 Tax=Penicillium angulare TaxID=116970 RepID=A0A9W9FWU4_9EURO|nr:hypothetical protein N7456_004155 [Penicillium angulare]
MAVQRLADVEPRSPKKKSRLGRAVEIKEKVTKSKSKSKSDDKTKSKKQFKEKHKEKSKGRVWDPEKSYVGTITPPKFEPRGPRTKWQTTGEPILDVSKVPEGWNDEEPDLDPEVMMKHSPGLTYDSVRRLETLCMIHDWMTRKSESETGELLETVRCLITAYQRKDLEWTPGLVTYWSNGKQLCQPRPFDWKEFAWLNAKHEGWKGFWVEGLHGPGPGQMFYKHKVLYPAVWPNERYHVEANVKIPIAIRIPGAESAVTHAPTRVYHEVARVPDFAVASDVPLAGEERPATYLVDPEVEEGPLSSTRHDMYIPYPHYTFWMQDDTGSQIMQIYRYDLELLQRLESRTARSEIPLPPVMGVTAFYDCDERLVFRVVRALEVNMFDDEGKEMSPNWDWIECAIKDRQGDPDVTIRLAGPWLRHRFYTATSPDKSGRLYVHDKYRGFLNVNRPKDDDSGPLPGVHLTSPPESPRIAVGQ